MKKDVFDHLDSFLQLFKVCARYYSFLISKQIYIQEELPVFQLCSPIHNIEDLAHMIEKETMTALQQANHDLPKLRSYTISGGHLYHDYYKQYLAINKSIFFCFVTLFFVLFTLFHF